MDREANTRYPEAERLTALRKAVFTEMSMPRLGEAARLLGGKGVGP